MKRAWLVYPYEFDEDDPDDVPIPPEFWTKEPSRYTGSRQVEIVYAVIEEEEQS